MPPRRTSTPFDDGLFPVKVTDISAAPSYQFVEVWDAGAGTLVEKVGGRYGGANNPGVDVLGSTFTLNQIVWCRPAEGRGGLTWELFSMGGGAAAISSGLATSAANSVSAAVDETWYSASMTLSLPTAGTYFIFGQIQFFGQMTSGAGWLSYRLYDATNATALTLEYDVGSFGTLMSFLPVPLCSVVTVTGAITLAVQVLRQASVNWSSAGIAGGGRSPAYQHMGYLKIG